MITRKDALNMDKDVKIIAVAPPQVSRGINFMEGLALLLIGMKLGGKLEDWTWIETLAPFWAPFMINWFMYLMREPIGYVMDRVFPHKDDQED